MGVWERAEYALAERLGMTVQNLRTSMSVSEFIGWMQYSHTLSKDAEDKAAPLDVTTMAPDQLKELFG